MSAIILTDEIVHYEVLGRGRPVIFLHGWVGSWRYWIPAMQSASISFRAYALDLWGFGDTAKVAARYPLEQQAKLVELFLDGMGIGKVALVGHGLGALAAALYAARSPDSVDRLMLIALPTSEGSLNTRLRQAMLVELTDWLLPRAAATAAVRDEASKADAHALQTSLVPLQPFFQAETFPRLRVPYMWVHGAADPLIFEPRPEILAALPESAHFIAFEQSGHFPMLDEASKFNRLLADFLALGSGESPRQLQLKEEWRRRVR